MKFCQDNASIWPLLSDCIHYRRGCAADNDELIWAGVRCTTGLEVAMVFLME